MTIDPRIERYFTLAATDLDGFLAQFTDDAVVTDEGRTHDGIAAIRAWRTSVPEVRRILAIVANRLSSSPVFPAL
ncbi:nuclear transport factor 2 family protein, partial [Pseudonocardia xishanensis]|uniref:nuclear transport factor 2 family protein n=1 Tax=Pseudonocardia xishanensis TaxID=630995 RepID=UPI0031EB36ED